jgi:hypothetical protein
MAKKGLWGGCHFKLLEFFEWKWQKKAKTTVNSRGGLFLRSLQLEYKNSLGDCEISERLFVESLINLIVYGKIDFK